MLQSNPILVQMLLVIRVIMELQVAELCKSVVLVPVAIISRDSNHSNAMLALLSRVLM